MSFLGSYDQSRSLWTIIKDIAALINVKNTRLRRSFAHRWLKQKDNQEVHCI